MIPVRYHVHNSLETTNRVDRDGEHDQVISDLKDGGENDRTWTELAAFLGHADLLARRTGQRRTSCFCVEPLTGGAAVETVALYALFRRDFLTVIVNHSVQITLHWRQLLITER